MIKQYLPNIVNYHKVSALSFILLLPVIFLAQKEPIFFGFEQPSESNLIQNNYQKHISADKAKNGTKSLFLKENELYGPTLSIRNGFKKKWVTISVWKSGEGGAIVASISEQNFYIARNDVIAKENGWDRIELTLLIPDVTVNEELKIYLYNNKKSNIYFDDFSITFMDEYPYSNFSSLPKININIPAIQQQKLDRFRRKAFLENRIAASSKKYFKSTGQINANKEIRLNYRLKGDWLDHLKDDKWSFRIKLKDSLQLFEGVKTFSVQNPITRSFLKEWLLHKVLASEDILTTKYDFIWLTINGKSKGIYAFEEHFEKYLLERQQRREAPIFKFNENGFWEVIEFQQKTLSIKPMQEYYALDVADIKPFKKGKTFKDSLLHQQFEKGSQLLSEFRSLNPKALHYIDHEKFGKYLALTDVFKNYHALNWINLRFYLNPISGLIEPVVYDGYEEHPSVKWNSTPMIGYIDAQHNTISNLPQGIIAQLFKHPKFRKHYYESLNKYTSKNFLDAVFSDYAKDISRLTYEIQKEFPTYTFNKNDYYKNSDTLRSVIKNSQQHLLSAKNNFNYVSLWDWREQHAKTTYMPTLTDSIFFPSIALKGQYKNKQLHLISYNPSPIKVIGLIKKDTTLMLDHHPLLMDKYNPQDKPKQYVIDETKVKEVLYQIGNKEYKTKISKKAHIDIHKSISFISPPLTDFFIEKDGVLYLNKKETLIDHQLLLPADKKLKLIAGDQIRFVKNGALVVKGNIEMIGNKKDKIIITGENNTNGIIVSSAGSVSVNMKHVTISNLGNVSTFNITTTGGLTIYKANCTISDCSFKNSLGEDLVNLVNCSSSISNSTFENAYSDALDIDYGKGKIVNCQFLNSQNDNIDISSAVYQIEKTASSNAKDKAISCGEHSTVTIINSTINNSVSGIVAKDKSVVSVSNSRISNCDFGVKVFQKKPEYDGAQLIIKKTTFKENKQNQYKDQQSSITIQ